MNSCTLLVIHHEGSEEIPMGSLWILNGDGRADCSERNLPGWIEIAGPIDVNWGLEIGQRLREFFHNAGLQVFLEAIAD